MRSGPAAVVLAVALVLVGCGEQAPSEAVPELADRLERVDAAIADDQPAGARRAVDALVRAATQARMDGEITADQADDILRAAAALLQRLPSGVDDPTPDPTAPTEPTEPASPEPPPAPAPGEGDDEGDDEKDEKHEKGKKPDHEPGKPKGPDKPKKPH
jgi:hypothetical protein